MKYIISNKILVVLIILSLTSLLVLKINKKSRTKSVFNDYNIYESYIINLEDKYVTSKNIDNYIFDEIEEIYPIIDKKYENIIRIEWYKIDKLINKKNNIIKMEKYYQEEFNKNALDEEAIKINLNGLRIKKVKIVTNDINKYKNYKTKKIYAV